MNKTFADWDGTTVSDELTYLFHQQERATRDALAERAAAGVVDPINSLTTDQIYELAKRSEAAQAETNRWQQVKHSVETFVAEEPRYTRDPQNMRRMSEYLEARGLRGDSPEDYHTAFSALDAAGLLKTKPVAVQPRRAYTEQDLRSMPIEELRELAESETRTQNSTTRIVGTRR